MRFFSQNKVNDMQSRRKNALTELKRLVENLKNCKKVLSDRTWDDELDRIWVWAKNDGTKSSLPEINKRIEESRLKVRHRFTSLCLSVPLFQFFLVFFL